MMTMMLASRAAPAAAPKVKRGWKGASSTLGKAPLNALVEERKKEALEKAKLQYDASMIRARKAWVDKDLAVCDEELKIAQQLNPRCEVVARFRAEVHAREGRFDDALTAAGRALAEAPANPRSHYAFAVAAQQKGMLKEAGTAYLSSFQRGMPGSSKESGFSDFLSNVSRRREFFDNNRPGHFKSRNGGIDLARTPSRSSILQLGADSAVPGSAPLLCASWYKVSSRPKSPNGSS